LRSVELPHHIHDLLRKRYLIRRGHSVSELLWIGGAATAELPSPDTDPVLTPLARAAAAAWSDLLSTEEA
jgi:hypothetical protein